MYIAQQVNTAEIRTEYDVIPTDELGAEFDNAKYWDLCHMFLMM